MKKLLLSLAAAAMTAGLATAAEVTLNVNDATNFDGTLTEEQLKDDGSVKAAKHYQPINSFDLGGFQFSFTSGTNKTAPAYYWASSTNKNQQRTVRLYGDNTMTVAAPAGTEMTQIEFSLAKNDKSANLDANVGTSTLTEKLLVTWTGAAQSVTFTAGGTIQIKEIKITTGSSSQETLAMPTFDPASGASFADQLAVSISAAEGAAIYYTLDGSAPTKDSDKYEGAPIVLTATTTIKAFAAKDGMNDSPVATATYTKDEAIETIEDLIKAGLEDEKTEFTYSGKAVVTYVNGANLYVRDETASILVYGTLDRTYEQGDVLSGFKGTFKNYFSTYELMANKASFTDPVGTETVEPYEMTIEQITSADQNEYVVIRGVSNTAEAISQNGKTLALYDKFKVGIPETEEIKDVTGIVSWYQAKGADAPALQLYPITWNGASSVEGIQAESQVLVQNGSIIAPEGAQVYSVSGARLGTDNLPAGVYVVRTGSKAVKVLVK